jgi:hypothetical protein
MSVAQPFGACLVTQLPRLPILGSVPDSSPVSVCMSSYTIFLKTATPNHAMEQNGHPLRVHVLRGSRAFAIVDARSRWPSLTLFSLDDSAHSRLIRALLQTLMADSFGSDPPRSVCRASDFPAATHALRTSRGAADADHLHAGVGLSRQADVPHLSCGDFRCRCLGDHSIFIPVHTSLFHTTRSVKLRRSSNHAMERTADRCAFTFEMISIRSLRSTRALVRRRSSCSR